MLYIIPTPIWNKEDITLRWLRLMQEVHIFFCEDTRTTRKLMRMYEIDYRTKHFHTLTSFSGEGKLQHYINLLLENDCALVSEAGTPWLSDPGKNLIKLCWERNIPFEVLPGANAIIPAVVASYTDTTKFTYLWFPPIKKGKQTFLTQILHSVYPVYIYESVHRVEKTLKKLKSMWFTWKVFLVRELSKMYEQKVWGTIDEILGQIVWWEIPMKWEFVIGFLNT